MKNSPAKLFKPGGIFLNVRSVYEVFKGKAFFAVLKWILFAVNAAYLYIVLHENASLTQLWQQFKSYNFTTGNIILISLTIAFVAVNWGIEARKWQKLITKFQPLKYRQAYAAILAGSAVSLWIPNRAGDYLGRIFWLHPKQHLRGVLATLVGSLAQICITLILGVTALVFYALHNVKNDWIIIVAPVLSALLVALLLFFYFNINKIKYVLPKYNWALRLRKYLMVYSFYKFNDLLLVLWLSFLRYAVFSTQFLFMLFIFGIDVSVFQGIISIALIYLVQTVVPSTALSELGIRGAASVFFLQQYTVNAAAVLSASYALWFLNLLLPGLLGLVALLFVKIRKKAV